MKNVLHILRIVGTLFLIAALVAASLAGINAITQPRIAEYKAEKMEKAMKEVLPEGENLNAVAFTDETGMVNAVYACDAGFVVEVAPAGFGGTISMMVGIDMEGAVKGVSIVSQTETAGLGAVAAATTSSGQAFRDQFVGLSGTLAVDKDGGQVDSITGATITTRAITYGVNAALACVRNLG